LPAVIDRVSGKIGEFQKGFDFTTGHIGKKCCSFLSQNQG
jgi:hypothetical protein